MYSLLNPAEIQKWPQTGEFATGVLLSLNERESVFQGAITLVIIQSLMIGLVISELMTTEINPPNSFTILIPRMIASFFMHANLQAEIKNGLRTMKYVACHPYMFRKFDLAIDEKSQED